MCSDSQQRSCLHTRRLPSGQTFQFRCRDFQLPRVPASCGVSLLPREFACAESESKLIIERADGHMFKLHHPEQE
eukprot:2661548-Pleurochrysis_carterae.AAC.1